MRRRQATLTHRPIAATPMTRCFVPTASIAAVVAYGPMGKGMVGRSLVHGRDWSALEAVETAVGQLATAYEQLAGVVIAARRLGHSWGERGVALGVTTGRSTALRQECGGCGNAHPPRLWITGSMKSFWEEG